MRTCLLLCLACVGCMPTQRTFTTTAVIKAPTATGASLKPVTIAELEKAIAEKKGKVVVLDIWFLGCAPCQKKFPSFVELHHEFAGKGLTCMSVDVELTENEKRPEVLEFLKEKGAAFDNFIIDDTVKARDEWQAKNDANGTPSYVVYNREGVRVPVQQSIKPDEMKEVVKKLLAESP